MNTLTNIRVKDFSKTTDYIQITLIYIIALLTPLFLEKILSNYISNSQLIVGTIVNLALVISALNITGYKKILGIITMPSVATVLSGYIFKGPQISFMIMMIPAIWVGNYTFVYLIKKLYIKNKINYFISGIISSICKVLVISLYFIILINLIKLPDKMANLLKVAMTYNQLITSLSSIVIAYIILKLETKNKKN